MQQNQPKVQAEAAIRVQESQHMRQEEAVKRLQMPEARMRLHESAKIASAEQAAATAKSRSAPMPAFRAPQKKSAVVDRPLASSSRAPVRNAAVVAAVDAAYDPAKNPFDGEDDGAGGLPAAGQLSGSLAKEATTLNPFGEFDDDAVEDKAEGAQQKPLDKNLNPFE